MKSAPAGRRLGIFGGTFDPPHLGHVTVARDVADALELDQLLWIPVARSPHKPEEPSAPNDLRLEMVRTAAAEDERFRVDTSELQRSPPSYTVETLRALRCREPDAQLYLIVGADQLRAFGDWHEPEAILEMARLAVMDRDGDSAADLVRREGMERHAEVVPVTRVDVSSTEVRARAAAGRDLAGLVPEGVKDVIEREGLYAR